MIAMQRIQEYADRVAEAFRPTRIILFGSYAYGTPTEDSDVDLLVVMPAEKRDTRKALEIIQSVRAEFPLDLLVYDPEYLRQRAGMEDWFVREIVDKGQVLHEEHHAGVG